jgi:hypothetical protein
MKKLSERDEKTTTTTITEKKKLIKRAGVWFVEKKKRKTDERVEDNHRCGKHKNANGMLIRLQKKKLSGYPPPPPFFFFFFQVGGTKKRKDGFCIQQRGRNRYRRSVKRGAMCGRMFFPIDTHKVLCP